MSSDNLKNEEKISLKEAGERFGYSADYVGQLIRKGKVEGVQVHANVAWMTTAKAMEDFIVREKGKNNERLDAQLKVSSFDSLVVRFFQGRMNLLYRYLLRGMLFLFAILALFSFYLISIAVDHALEKKAERDFLLREKEYSAKLLEQSLNSKNTIPL